MEAKAKYQVRIIVTIRKVNIYLAVQGLESFFSVYIVSF